MGGGKLPASPTDRKKKTINTEVEGNSVGAHSCDTLPFLT